MNPSTKVTAPSALQFLMSRIVNLCIGGTNTKAIGIETQKPIFAELSHARKKSGANPIFIATMAKLMAILKTRDNVILKKIVCLMLTSYRLPEFI